MNVNLTPNINCTNVNLQPNITGANVNISKGATQADLTNSVNNSKTYRDEAEAFSIVSEDKSIEASYSALNASISATTASDKATIATTKANEANNSAINASASEAVCIAKATITTDKANVATAQSVIATDKASEASTYADTATTQAGIAITKASEASVSASSALASKNAASSSAISALASANSAADSEANSIASSTSAEGSAIMATTKANEASSSAYNANNSAIDALSSKNSAIASASSATLKASEASSSATVSANKASEASTSASNALVSANNANTSEANALIYRNQAESFANSINHSDLVHISGTETITGNKTFSGTVSGLTKATVGLSNVDNTSDSAKNVLYATTAGTASANDVYAWAKALVKPTYTASEVGLGNVTNESKATMFTNPTFTGTATGAFSGSLSGNATTATNVAWSGITSKPTTLSGYGITDSVKNFGTVTINPAGSNTTCTTAQFVSWLTTLGAFSFTMSVMKCSWDYAGNNDITDTGFGTLDLAGCIVETFTDGSQYIIRVTSPSTGAGAGGIHEYINHGSAYSPGWRRVYTSSLNGNISGSSGSCSGNAATATALSGVVGSAPSYACRAWVNFNGTGTVAIRASGNVSSITDNGVGNYTVNFTTAMSDVAYCAAHSSRTDSGYTNDTGEIGTRATSSIQLRNTDEYTHGFVDSSIINLAIFR